MTNKVVLFFTAASAPTVQETADIAALAEYPGLTLRVRNAGVETLREVPETADYVSDSNAGATIPDLYDDTDDYPRTYAANPPAPTVLSTQKVITSGVEFTGPATSGSRVDGWTPTIVAGAVTALTGS